MYAEWYLGCSISAGSVLQSSVHQLTAVTAHIPSHNCFAFKQGEMVIKKPQCALLSVGPATNLSLQLQTHFTFVSRSSPSSFCLHVSQQNLRALHGEVRHVLGLPEPVSSHCCCHSTAHLFGNCSQFPVLGEAALWPTQLRERLLKPWRAVWELSHRGTRAKVRSGHITKHNLLHIGHDLAAGEIQQCAVLYSTCCPSPNVSHNSQFGEEENNENVNLKLEGTNCWELYPRCRQCYKQAPLLHSAAMRFAAARPLSFTRSRHSHINFKMKLNLTVTNPVLVTETISRWCWALHLDNCFKYSPVQLHIVLKHNSSISQPQTQVRISGCVF